MSEFDGAIEAPVSPSGALAGESDVAVPNEPQKSNKEARYRVERNEAREALDAANARIEALQRREAERLAANDLADPSDLLSLGGVTVADLVGEDGEVDPEKVAGVVASVLGTRPGLKRLSPAFDPTQGVGSPKQVDEASWAALFRS